MHSNLITCFLKWIAHKAFWSMRPGAREKHRGRPSTSANSLSNSPAGACSLSAQLSIARALTCPVCSWLRRVSIFASASNFRDVAEKLGEGLRSRRNGPAAITVLARHQTSWDETRETYKVPAVGARQRGAVSQPLRYLSTQIGASSCGSQSTGLCCRELLFG